MAIVQISRIQHRRGLNQDLPQLSSAELGWSVDTQQLYIGNGTLSEGAPVEGKTEILTSVSGIRFTANLNANIAILQGNITTINGNITTINSQIAALQSGITTSNVAVLSTTSGNIATITTNNATINYTLTQSGKQRTGVIKMSRSGSTFSIEEDYSETATTDVVFSISGSSVSGNLTYTQTTYPSTLLYQVKNV